VVPFSLKEKREELRAIYAMICDTGMFPVQGALYRDHVRGLMAEKLTHHRPRLDLHSACTAAYPMTPRCSVKGDRIAAWTTQSPSPCRRFL